MDKAFFGENARFGYTRFSVYHPLFDSLVNHFASLGAMVYEVTRRKLGLGDRHATTGWRAKSFTESTIEGVFLPRSSTRIAVAVGTYMRLDAMFFTADVVKKGDEIKTVDNQYWEVKAVREFWEGDCFSHRECDLTLLPLHE